MMMMMMMMMMMVIIIMIKMIMRMIYLGLLSIIVGDGVDDIDCDGDDCINVDAG